MARNIVPSKAALTILAALAYAPPVFASAVCYYPNGDVANTYQPCGSTSGGAVACCELSTSACSTTGYCYGSAGVLYRGGCTDQSWSSSSCPSRCSDVNRGAFSNINLCPGQDGNTLFTCSGFGKFTLDLCLNNFTINAGTPFTPSTVSQGAASSTTSISTSTSTSASTSTGTTTAPSSTATTESSCATPLTVGLATGIPLGALAAFLALVVFWQHRRYSKQNGSTTAQPSYGGPPQGSVWGTQPTPSMYYQQPSLAPGSTPWVAKPPQVAPVLEIDTPAPIHELR